jgi:hypothetical protein
MGWRRGTARRNRNEVLARAREARATRSRRRGALLIAFGYAVVPVVAIVASALRYGREIRGEETSAAMTSLPMSVALLIAFVCVVRGRRLRVREIEPDAAGGDEPPILFLRPFTLDRTHFRGSYGSRKRVRLSVTGPKTYEDWLSRLLKGVAPLVAVGDPSEHLPHLGAARVYADDQEWRQTVDDLLGRGGVVILHVADSPGVAWEVERIVALGEPERVILSLPLAGKLRERRSPERVYAAFRDRFGDAFPKGLPAKARDTQFLYFDADWTPRQLEAPGGVPAVPPPGSPGEQRAHALRALAPAFRPLWAPFWVRLLAYSAAVVVPLLAVYLATSVSPAKRVAECVERARDVGAPGIARPQCQAFEDRHHLEDDGALVDDESLVKERSARLYLCGMTVRDSLDRDRLASQRPRAWRAELTQRFCTQTNGGLTHNGEDLERLNAIALEMDQEQSGAAADLSDG